MTLLEIKNLSVCFDTLDGQVHAVNDVSFSLAAGEKLAIVGESGSGKTQCVSSIIGLLANNGHARGEVIFHGQNLLLLNDTELNKIRGNKIAMIFQDPMTSLNPYLRISTQMLEVLTHHRGMTKNEARTEALRMLELVRIPDANNRFDHYPHEFSGGMRQRVAIAMALLCKPELIIADEPTTALDVTVQAQIIELLKDINQEFNTAMIMITHDLAVVSSLCDQILVLYGGETMEWGSLEDIHYAAANPYTIGLLNSVPRPGQGRGEALRSIPGNPPNLLHPINGCPFYPRCDRRLDQCQQSKPKRIEINPGHFKACHIGVNQ